MDSLSVTEIKTLLKDVPRKAGETAPIIEKFPSANMKLVMGKVAEWIAAINSHDEYVDHMVDSGHVPFIWITGEDGVG